jgi:hypothetical protein
MSDDDLDPKKAFEVAQMMGTGREERVDDPIYKPPPGRPQYVDALQRYRYTPDEPTSETMQMEEYEQRHVYEVASRIAGLFGEEIHPIPDAMYNLVPQVQRASQLFCIVSRSGVKRLDANRIAWPAIQVVIKEIPILKVVATLDFSRDEFQIWQIIFWRNDISGYEKPITRGRNSIPAPMAVEFIARYIQAEGIR